MPQQCNDSSEYRFLTSPSSNLECRLVSSANGPELQIFGNRAGLLSLANILLWLLANAWRREFLSLGELEFIRLEGQLSVCIRLTDEDAIGTHGLVRRLDHDSLLEWVISEDELKAVALLIHGLVSGPCHEYDRLLTGEESVCAIHIRMTDVADWLKKGIF